MLIYIVGVLYTLENILWTLAAFLEEMTHPHGRHLQSFLDGFSGASGIVSCQLQLYSVYTTDKGADC